MRVVYDGLNDGPTNMDADSVLLHQAENGVASARVYGWDGPWVSLGRFQKADTSLRSNAPVQWVKRPTGGRGVLHGHDVTLGMALPLNGLLPPAEWRRIRSVYRAAIAPLVAALRACGVDAGLGESIHQGEIGRSPDCFAAVSANDIVDLRTGIKICGCALRLTETAVLAQCSIPAGPPLVDPAHVYVQAAPPHWITLDAREFTEMLAGQTASPR